MATYRKVEIVEAAQYEGAPLTVVHDHLGEQKAVAGDWLLGTERGKIRVMSAKQFAAEFKPYTDEEPGRKKAAAADKREISEFNALITDMNLAQENLHAALNDAKAEIAFLDLSRANLQTALDDAMEQIADLKKQKAALNKQIAANTEVIREHPVSQHKTPVKTAAKKK